jgi:hypothetical protein
LVFLEKIKNYFLKYFNLLIHKYLKIEEN